MGNSKSSNRNAALEARRTITKKQFYDCIREMNNYFSTVKLDHDSRLLFTINRDSDSFISWKDDITVACFQVRKDDQKRTIKRCKMLDFNSFMNAYDMRTVADVNAQDWMTTSTIILNESACNDGLCVICMERSNEILLTCLHSFCLTCIANETEYRPQFRCPLCLENIKNPIDDSWQVADHPDKEEINKYIGEITK